ncbi:MAG TPA: 16S rRNA (cytosine(967)-C(5))-methyltransferase RsmB [Candidatus Limnocylindrales bacterium]|nr:16S rRNA (cytosine(967)-C(5))-methyltransferase RsmB [Candidatus Limnocylindrales bacterium]
MNDQNPRQIAWEVLRQRRAGGSFTEALLERALAKTGIAAVDRALCQELVYGVVRWQAALDWLISRKTDKREQNPGLQNLLRLGLYQIFWLDRIPDHAAVHATVELAKRNGFGSHAGFMNAVLRGYLREQDEATKLLADLKNSRPALGWSHPEWLVARWQQRWGAEKAARLLEWNNTPPKTFARVNTLKFRRPELSDAGHVGARGTRPSEIQNAGDLLARWREENVEYDFVRRDWLEENLVFELKSHPSLASLESFRQGWFYVQDPGTLLAPGELNPRPGETILDFCAAPGGKTTFLAQLMNNQGRIVAQDVSEERLRLIQENCARLGVTCVETTQKPRPKTQNLKFDRILVDAPCSNTGVMRRRVDLRWRIQLEEILRLQQTQLGLLEQAAPKLKPGGVLVYSTCSLEPEENQEVVKQFLHGHKDFNLESGRELLPFADGVDGAFVARLKRLP